MHHPQGDDGAVCACLQEALSNAVSNQRINWRRLICARRSESDAKLFHELITGCGEARAPERSFRELLAQIERGGFVFNLDVLRACFEIQP